MTDDPTPYGPSGTSVRMETPLGLRHGPEGRGDNREIRYH